MRVHSLDKRYALDRAGFLAFLSAQGFTEDEIAQLSIYIRQEGVEGDLGDYHNGIIYIYTYGLPLSEVNNTLLHETRHYWQYCQYRRQRELAYQAASRLKGAAKRKAFAQALRIYPHEESHLDYWERPRELDARSFAAEQEKQHQFFRWQRTCNVTIPLAWIEDWKRLESRVRHLGGRVSKQEERVVVSGVLKEDVAKLKTFLQPQGWWRTPK